MKSSGPEHVRRLAWKAVTFLELWNIVLAKYCKWLYVVTLRKPSNASLIQFITSPPFPSDTIPSPWASSVWASSVDTLFVCWEGHHTSQQNTKMSRQPDQGPGEGAFIYAARRSRDSATASIPSEELMGEVRNRRCSRQATRTPKPSSSRRASVLLASSYFFS